MSNGLNRLRLLAKLSLTAAVLALLAILAFRAIQPLLHQDPAVVLLPINGPPSPGKFSGRVLDAQTHRPVQNFSAQVGWSWRDSRQAEAFGKLKGFSTGEYQVNPPDVRGCKAWFIRIEAHGYLSADSPAMLQPGPRDFTLTAAPDIHGRVLMPGGMPAPHARIALATSNQEVSVSGGLFDNATNHNFLTDADGQFDLPPQTGKFALAAIDDAGFAQVDQDTFAHNATIHLAPWAAVQGRLMIGAKPAPGQWVLLIGDTGQTYLRDDPLLRQNEAVQADSQGRYRFARVAPGFIRWGRFIVADHGSGEPARLARQYWDQMQRSAIGSTEPTHIAPGQTVSRDFNSRGCPVIGRIVFSRPADLRIYIADESRAPPTPYVPQTDLDRNTDFRIDDMSPGPHLITINALPLTPSGKVRSARFQFTMPPIPGGVSDDPLILKDIILPDK